MLFFLPSSWRYLWLLCGLLLGSFFSCEKDQLAPMAVETCGPPLLTHHGYLYVGCLPPPYYLHLDSLVAHCSLLGPLPDSLPIFEAPETIDHFCTLDKLAPRFGDAQNWHLHFKDFIEEVLVRGPLEGSNREDIPIYLAEFEEEFQPGEGPYLGGYRYTKENQQLLLQVVNVYIGGCFHNVIIWEWQR